MALTAISTEEVAGSTARELTDDEVTTVLSREAKKRRESAEAFAGAGRTELAEREQAEGGVIARYLPQALTEAEITELVRVAITETGASGPREMGAVMKVLRQTAMPPTRSERLPANVRVGRTSGSMPGAGTMPWPLFVTDCGWRATRRHHCSDQRPIWCLNLPGEARPKPNRAR